MDERLRRAIEEGAVSAIEQLVAEGVDINAEPVLPIAVYPWGWSSQKVELVKHLLRLGARTRGEDPRACESSVHIAAKLRDLELMQALLGADGKAALNRFNDFERTPLMIAVEGRHWEMAKLLLSSGSDVNARDEERNGDTALTLAISKVLGEGSKAVTREDVKMVALLMAHGADPELEGWMRMSPRSHLELKRTGNDDPALLDEIELLLGSPRST